MTDERKKLAAAFSAMTSEMVDVLIAWENLESAGQEAPIASYPFPDSFDEVLNACFAYRDELAAEPVTDDCTYAPGDELLGHDCQCPRCEG